MQPFRSAVHFQIDYAAELNVQQLEAVTAPPGPALVLAGAGAGKTRTLVYRVAWLLEQGVAPERLLLLTFTNKAAREMMRRVGDLLGCDLGGLWGGTFHAVGLRVLRRHAERIGYRRDFTILDREDAKDLVSACLAETDLDIKAARFPKAEVLSDLFSLSVNTAQPLERVLERHYPAFQPLQEAIAEVARRYTARKQADNVMDFDDLLALWLRLWREDPEVRATYQRRFQHVLVDEYQDTTQLQSDLVDLLVGGHHQVMAVGDDAQSIYSWRGANFQNILRFPERHPGTRIYRIETNYRSTPEILSLANAAIAANVHQHKKELRPVRPNGARPARVVCADAQVQAAFVAQRVLELQEEGVALGRMAVLYRSHFHALELQLELTRRHLPFSITSGLRFFEQAHIKDVAAWLKLVCNPRDEMAFKRLVKLLPGIGPKAADKLWRTYTALDLPAPAAPPPEDTGRAVDEIWQPEGAPAPTAAGPTALPAGEPVPTPRLAAGLQSLAGQVPKKAQVPWAQFTATVAQLEVPPVRNSAADMIRLVLEAGYAELLEAHYPNARARLEDLEQLAVFARQFASPEDCLAQLALLSSVEAEAEAAPASETERLRLSTVHQAKGLEFDVVFVIMLCEGLFPSARSVETKEGVEEERRLFYVALTRARDELYLSYPLLRTAGAYGGDALQQPSRFLEELPPHLLEDWSLVLPGGGGWA